MVEAIAPPKRLLINNKKWRATDAGGQRAVVGGPQALLHRRHPNGVDKSHPVKADCVGDAHNGGGVGDRQAAFKDRLKQGHGQARIGATRRTSRSV